MASNILLIVAYDGIQPVAATFNLFDHQTLYGRYWGALKHVPNLHFELCYYQAQEFCIANGIQYFEGGAQGEHKLARGFEPCSTCSYHYIRHPEFKVAIQDFLNREELSMTSYTNELEERSPFKHVPKI